MPIVGFYAALFGIFFAVLSIRTIRQRNRVKVAIGDSGDAQLIRSIRVHSNFAEYVPLCLFLLYMVEVTGINPLLLHGLCSIFILGRISHAYGVSQVDEKFKFRIFGMMVTFATLVISSLYLLFNFLMIRANEGI